MPDYEYVAQTHSGSIERGHISGAAPDEAREKLLQRGRRLVGIQEAGTESVYRRLLTSFQRGRSVPIRPSDIELMLRQLAVMLESGLELTPSLRELSFHSPKRRQQQICLELVDAVNKGSSLAAALSATRSFPSVVTQLVRMGEETGELAIALQRGAKFVESRRLALSHLLSTLAYPLVVAIAACSVATYLVGWTIPKLATFLHAMGRKLPAMTQSLLDLSGLIQTCGLQLAVIFGTSVVALVLMYAWRPARYRIDQTLLRLPLIGSLMQMSETQQLASSVALMLRSGVFLPDALETASTLHHNRYLASQVMQSRNRLAQGRDFAGSLGGLGFGPLLPSMVAVGERTGDLPNALEHVASFYAAQVETKLQRLGRLIEPTIIVVVGAVVGYVYIAFFMALFSAGGGAIR